VRFHASERRGEFAMSGVRLGRSLGCPRERTASASSAHRRLRCGRCRPTIAGLCRHNGAAAITVAAGMVDRTFAMVVFDRTTRSMVNFDTPKGNSTDAAECR
jgi:hypothetical protein